MHRLHAWQSYQWTTACGAVEPTTLLAHAMLNIRIQFHSFTRHCLFSSLDIDCFLTGCPPPGTALSCDAPAVRLALEDAVRLDSAATGRVYVTVSSLSSLTAIVDRASLSRLACHDACLPGALGNRGGDCIADGLRSRRPESLSGQEGQGDRGGDAECSNHGLTECQLRTQTRKFTYSFRDMGLDRVLDR